MPKNNEARAINELLLFACEISSKNTEMSEIYKSTPELRSSVKLIACLPSINPNTSSNPNVLPEKIDAIARIKKITVCFLDIQ
ncbi:MAG: hypothetical protein UZ22_OP11002000017 [Microgenomates bacterium OLB23]|nr:MAG: hypothetical protein UZ22_OP11002000017 [Microgenomates bacterium OLB23]